MLDEHLKFDKHVDHIKKLVRPFIPLMWRNGKFIPLARRKHLFFAYVQSHFLYMLSVYGECGVTKMAELQTLQNRCVKAMFRLPRFTSTTYLYSNTLMPITLMASVERVTNVHKMTRSLTKHNFRFATNVAVHGRELRNFNNMYVLNPYSILNSTNAALVLALNEYNDLDLDVRLLTCLKTFKASVKLRLMKMSVEFSPISPFTFIN